MLLAGAVASVLMLHWHVEFFPFTRNLVTVFAIFYALGSVIKVILDKNFPEMEDEPAEEPEEEAAEGEEEDGESTENVEMEEENLNEDS